MFVFFHGLIAEGGVAEGKYNIAIYHKWTAPNMFSVQGKE
jgi:hypothetical protein